MSQRLHELLAELSLEDVHDSSLAAVDADQVQAGEPNTAKPLPPREYHWVRYADEKELAELADYFRTARPLVEPSRRRLQSAVLGEVCLALRHRIAQPAAEHLPLSPDHIEHVYRRFGPEFPDAYALLGLLTARGDDVSLRTLSQLLVELPPPSAQAVVVACAPLFQNDDYDPGNLFPKLLEGLTRPALAASILDLANYVTRRGMTDIHPAHQRRAQLAELLGHVAQELQRLEESPPGETSEVAVRQNQVAEAVALAIALCDALSLIGDQTLTGKIHQVMDLRHRPLQTEAAAALAKLGDPSGKKRLIELAAEPVVRLRVLAYAEQLGLLDDVAAEHRTPRGVAQAELVAWLSHPTQFGIAPMACEHVETRTLSWPGFETPVECHLFQFDYPVADGLYQGTGIAGPLALSPRFDISVVSRDDQFAYFAGWQAEHPEITESPASGWSAREQEWANELASHLKRQGFSHVSVDRLGNLLGTLALVARATRENQTGFVVTDGQASYWFPRGSASRPIDADGAWCIYKGRKLLETFNPGFGSENHRTTDR